MEHGLSRVELGDWWKNPTCIASEQNDVAGVVLRKAWNLSVGDVLDRVGTIEIVKKNTR